MLSEEKGADGKDISADSKQPVWVPHLTVLERWSRRQEMVLAQQPATRKGTWQRCVRASLRKLVSSTPQERHAYLRDGRFDIDLITPHFWLRANWLGPGALQIDQVATAPRRSGILRLLISKLQAKGVQLLRFGCTQSQTLVKILDQRGGQIYEFSLLGPTYQISTAQFLAKNKNCPQQKRE